MRRGAPLSSPSETAAKWRSIHLGLFFLLSQISRATKHPPLHGLKDADDMKRIAFMVLIFYLAQNYRKKSIRVKKKVIFLTYRSKKRQKKDDNPSLDCRRFSVSIKPVARFRQHECLSYSTAPILAFHRVTLWLLAKGPWTNIGLNFIMLLSYVFLARRWALCCVHI